MTSSLPLLRLSRSSGKSSATLSGSTPGCAMTGAIRRVPHAVVPRSLHRRARRPGARALPAGTAAARSWPQSVRLCTILISRRAASSVTRLRMRRANVSRRCPCRSYRRFAAHPLRRRPRHNWASTRKNISAEPQLAGCAQFRRRLVTFPPNCGSDL